MLRKLAEIAAYADQNKQYELADNTTKLLKEAQLWDALRTLFDPEHTPGVERNTPFWKRLSKGWSRGKMDRNLGLVLAIMTERTKLNEKINKITAPIKEFQSELASFYDKMQSGQIRSDNFKEESRSLQRGLKDTLNTISNKDLRNILKMRERLESQQMTAAEKIKGLDDETRNNLMAVLKGESLPGVYMGDKNMPSSAGGIPSGVVLDDLKRPFDANYVPQSLRNWLRTKRLAHMTMYHDMQSRRSMYLFKNYIEDYGYNPYAVYNFFSNNAADQGEGFAKFDKYFGEMLRRAEGVINADKKYAKEERGEIVPAQQVGTAPQKPEDIAYTDPMIASPFAEESTKKNVPPNPELEKQLEIKRRKEEEQKKDREMIDALLQREKTKEQKSSPAPLATSTAERIAREITRLGRIRALNKLAADPSVIEEELYKLTLPEEIERVPQGDPELWRPDLKLFPEEDSGLTEEEMAHFDNREDVYENLEGRERFDENKEYDQAEMMRDMYEDVQSKYEDPGTLAEDIENWVSEVTRIDRKIKFLELSGQGTQEEIDKLREEKRQLSNRIEAMEPYV